MHLLAITIKHQTEGRFYEYESDYYMFDTAEESQDWLLGYQNEESKTDDWRIDSWHICKVMQSNDERNLNTTMGIQD
jgi:hypothetical protein